MVFSYNWLKEYLKTLPQPEKLADLLNMHSFEVEEVKKEGKDHLIDIDVLPNRAADCFSHYGMAREISAIAKVVLKDLDVKFKADKKLKSRELVKVEVLDKSSLSRYSAKVISGVKIKPSPQWLVERLKSCGLRPINNVVDIANYVMLETGQPIHAFDLEKIHQEKGDGLRKIIVRRAKKGEKITSLDGEKYNLDQDVLVISDLKGPLAIAGIKGGKYPEIDQKTKTIVLEAANFDPQVVRKGSKKINLRTDASLRFEHGLDPNLTELAINRASSLIQEIVKGNPSSDLIDYYPKKTLPKLIKLDLSYLKSLLGMEVKSKDAAAILKRLKFQIIKSGVDYLLVKVPSFRLDINIPEDLIEEIIRIKGLENIDPVFPVSSLIPPKKNLEIFWEDMAKNIFKEAGFNEVYNYSFFGEEEASLFHYSKDELIELENPISSEQKYLRASLIPSLVRDVEKNHKNFKEIKIFELGKVFRNEKGFKEKRMLSFLITGDSFYEAKGIVDLFLNKLGISNIWYDDYKPTPENSRSIVWHSQKAAEIKADNEEIGFLGEISPSILSELKIDKVVVCDIDFEKLLNIASEEHEYRPISRFPAVVRDLAILTPQETRVVEILNIINSAGGSLVRDVDLFDIYQGEELPDGKKNLAFHIIFQAEDRTLSSNEVDRVMEKIIKILEEDPERQVRK